MEFTKEGALEAINNNVTNNDLSLEKVHMETKVLDIYDDSLDRIEMVMELESAFDINIDEDKLKIYEDTTFGNLFDQIQKLLS